MSFELAAVIILFMILGGIIGGIAMFIWVVWQFVKDGFCR